MTNKQGKFEMVYRLKFILAEVPGFRNSLTAKLIQQLSEAFLPNILIRLYSYPPYILPGVIY